jgi:hypothetical protein
MPEKYALLLERMHRSDDAMAIRKAAQEQEERTSIEPVQD